MRENLLKLALRGLFKPVMRPPVPLALQRGWVSALAGVNLPARGVDYTWELYGGVSAEVITPRAAEQPDPRGTLLYLHGGGYVLGSPATQRSISSFIARRSGWRVVVPDYRLAPEHPWPGPIDDAEAVWKALAGRYEPCALAGDSAGGGLALSLAHRLRDTQAVPPEALVLISPWVDLVNDRPSHRDRAARDPLLRHDWLQSAAAAYIDGQGEPDDPRWSPLFGTQEGLPRTLIQVGSEEVLHDDAVALSVALRDAGAAVQLEVFEGMWHDFQMHAAVLPRAAEAVDGMAAFLNTG